MLFGARKLEKAKPFKPNFLTSYGELIGSADFWIAARGHSYVCQARQPDQILETGAISRRFGGLVVCGEDSRNFSVRPTSQLQARVFGCVLKVTHLPRRKIPSIAVYSSNSASSESVWIPVIFMVGLIESHLELSLSNASARRFLSDRN